MISLPRRAIKPGYFLLLFPFLTACLESPPEVVPLDPLVVPNPNAPTMAMGGDATESACILPSDGNLLCWGNNSANQLGKAQADYDPHPQPEAPTGVAPAKFVDFGVFHACAALTGGQLSCWGGDYVPGMMGDGTGQLKIPPTQLPGIADAEEVGLGAYFGCARLAGGSVSCWGDNRQGQLGLGTIDDMPHDGPAPVPNVSGATQLAVGSLHACVLVSQPGGEVYCWGDNGQGQLGSFGTPSPLMPSENASVAELSAGSAFTCARTQEGKVYCWGNNATGQLGDGTQSDSSEPVLVSLDEPAISIAAGERHACAATARGHVFCWGQGGDGQLGTASLSTCPSGDVTYGCLKKPARVGVSRAFRVFAGGGSSCAALEDGSIRCWGRVGQARGVCKGEACAEPFELTW